MAAVDRSRDRRPVECSLPGGAVVPPTLLPGTKKGPAPGRAGSVAEAGQGQPRTSASPAMRQASATAADVASV
jgi:hypothetical protein